MTALVPQQVIAAACEEDLEKYGDNFRGVGYTRSPDEAAERYALMLDVVRETDRPLTVLDFGCGLAHLLDFMEASRLYRNLSYVGLDISPRYLDAARVKHPQHEFYLMDVLSADDTLPVFDYVILNGVFNYRGPIEQGRMVEYWEQLTTIAYRHCRYGIAFNVMSTLVDWERSDLFHLPIDTMARVVWTHLSRHFVVRHDYQAFEYTTYVYRSPFTQSMAAGQSF